MWSDSWTCETFSIEVRMQWTHFGAETAVTSMALFPLLLIKMFPARFFQQ